MLHHKKIITNGYRGYALDLLTGKCLTRIHPLTCERIAWGFCRNYGCNTAIASEYLLLFRSAAAGYFDLAHDSGTGNMGGFKSGCTSNLIPADGVLNAPDYTRTCICSYQNQCSLAMIHMPEAEMWTFSNLKYAGKPVERVGINIGAPGDRMSKNGTLWLDYPVVGGPSPNIPIKIGGDKLEYFRHHASLVHGPGLTWIAASGVIGLNQVTLSLAKENTETRPCTVRLYFAEPRTGIKAGDRVFNVTVHNKELLRNFDIFREAGAARRIVMKEFKDIAVSNQLTVAFSAQSGKPLVCGIEIVRLDTKEERGGE